MQTSNPFTKSANIWWDAIQDTASEQWWNPSGWIAKGYDRAGKGSSQMVGGTPLGNIKGDWNAGEIARGAGNVGLGALESVGTVAGAGGIASSAGRKLLGSTARVGGNALKATGKAGLGAGRVGMKTLGNTLQASYNAPMYLNPYVYSRGNALSRLGSNIARSMPTTVQRFAARTSPSALRNAFDPSMSGGIVNTLKNRAAIIGSSVLSGYLSDPLQRRAFGDESSFNYPYEQIKQTEQNFANPMNPLQQRAASFASNLPYYSIRKGLLAAPVDLGLRVFGDKTHNNDYINIYNQAGSAYRPAARLFRNDNVPAFEELNITPDRLHAAERQFGVSLDGLTPQEVYNNLVYRSGDTNRYLKTPEGVPNAQRLLQYLSSR